MLRKSGFSGLFALFLVFAAHWAFATPSTLGAKVYFVDLKDGQTVKSPVTVHFGISGMSLAPAGTMAPGTGHHHLLIDAKLDGEALKEPIPLDANHMHFGKAQTEATLTLAPGKHTLQLVLADGMHVPLDPPVMSVPVTINVE
jgi:hypothetical protein